MKALPFKIPKTGNTSFHFQVDDEPYFYDILHQHPEIQVTLIEKSTGSLVHGDYLGHFEPGDFFVIGPNVPHVFRNDDLYYNSEQRARAITVFFDRATFGEAFLNLPEAKGLRELIALAERGMQLKSPHTGEVAQLIRNIEAAQGMSRLVLVLQLVDALIQSDAYELLNTEGSFRQVDEVEGKRLNDIFRFTMERYNQPIRLDEVAAIANMSPSAFCRYFKQHTRKTYLEFLNEYRIGQACKWLMAGHRSIAQICYDAGFNNLSNFNRKFKEVTGNTPSGYVKQMVEK